MEEIWKDIEGLNGRYQISNLGRVKSLYGWDGHKTVKREKIMTTTIQEVGGGYKRLLVRLSGKNYMVHRLVAKAFIKNPNNFTVVNHKDCNPLNNDITNLEWCSQKYNVEHAIRNHRNRNFTYFDKDKAIELYKQGITAKHISKILNVNEYTIQNLMFKYHISRKEYKRKSKYNLSINDYKDLFNKGLSNKDISNFYNIPKVYIARRKYQIKKGEI